MQKSFLVRFIVLLTFGAMILADEPALRNGGWIDTHVHPVGGRGTVQDYAGAVKAALAAMDESGMGRMVLMPPPQIVQNNVAPYDCDAFLATVKQNPKRLAFLGGGGTLNRMIQETAQQPKISDELRRKFEAKAEEILRAGALGFGEIAADHLSITNGHPYESAPADHPLLLLLADIAARHDVVIDFHEELILEDMKTPAWLVSASSFNPPALRANRAGFERLLAHNPKAKIVWAHVSAYPLGNVTPELGRQFLTQYPNLFMGLKPLPNRFAPQTSMVTPFNQINPDWLQLLKDFPDRFVLTGDQFFASAAVSGSPAPALQFAQGAPIVRAKMRAFLDAQPPDLARKIGSENAIRIYKLDAK